MKSRLFVFCLIGLSVVMLFWLLRPKVQPETKPISEVSSVSTPQQEGQGTKSSSPASGASSPVPGGPTPSAISEPTAVESWLTARKADIEVNQTAKANLYYPGSIRVGGKDVSLGEDPPLVNHAIKTKAGTLLLGSYDDRNSYQRYLQMVRVVDGQPKITEDFYISHPRGISTSVGGLVFEKDQTEISRIGVIVPEVQVPQGDDPSSVRWRVSTRVAGQRVDPSELAKIEPHVLGPDTVVVMPTQQGPITTPVRVLWLNLDDKGVFTVANK